MSENIINPQNIEIYKIFKKLTVLVDVTFDQIYFILEKIIYNNPKTSKFNTARELMANPKTQEN